MQNFLTCYFLFEYIGLSHLIVSSRNEDQLTTCRNEMERLRQTNLELQQDASACREREAELLEFTQKLTEKNVRLQSEFSALEARVGTFLRL